MLYNYKIVGNDVGLTSNGGCEQNDNNKKFDVDINQIQ